MQPVQRRGEVVVRQRGGPADRAQPGEHVVEPSAVSSRSFASGVPPLLEALRGFRQVGGSTCRDRVTLVTCAGSRELGLGSRATLYYDNGVDGDLYDGIPVGRLPIDAVNVPDVAHLRRSVRYHGAMDIEPEHANEAVFHPRRLVARDPKSRTGEAVRVVGYSAGMGRVLVVLLVPDDHPPGGLWHVATAWPADSRTRRVYAGKGSENG